MKKILITGGAGYIGSLLARKLLEKGEKVLIVDNLSYGKKENIPDEATFYQLDILSSEFEQLVMSEKPDVLFHLAASKSVNESLEKPLEFAKTNILGSINVINSAFKAGVEKLIFTSTAGVYGDYFTDNKQSEEQKPHPSSPYGWTKLTIDDYISYMNEHNKTKYITLRFANVYGPGGISQYKSAIDIFVKKALNKQQITIHGDGNQTRDFVFIDDLVDVCLRLVDANLSAEEQLLFNVSTSKETTINDALTIIGKAIDGPLKTVYEPAIFAGQERSLLTNEKTKKVLSWEPKITLRDGIKKIIQTYEKK